MIIDYTYLYLYLILLGWLADINRKRIGPSWTV